MPRLAHTRDVLIVLVLSIALLAVGCGSPENRTRGGSSGQILVFGRGADSVGLDPAHEEDGESFKVAELIFDTLVEYQQDSTDIQPGLAVSWTSSDDGLHWRFKLREGVTFHDGTPFDASAVVFSIERQFKADHPFHDVGGPYLYWIALGLDDIFEAISAPSPTEVEITLKRPYAPLLSVLATPPFSIVNPAALEKWGEDFKSHPVGTGPYRFVEWRRDDRIVLDRYEGYWAGKPGPARIIFRSIPDNATRLLEIEQGNIQILEYPDPENLDAIRANPELRLIEQPGMNVGYLAMNMDHTPLDDVRVRRAINYAIDKQAIVDRLYNGLAVPATNPIPPTIWGYNDAIEDFGYDPGRARSILADVFPDGFPRELTLYVLPAPRPYFLNPQNIGLAIQSDLQKVGIPTRIETYEWQTYLEKVKKGDHDLAMLGWIADYADPDNFLYFNLDRDNTRPPAGNIAFYRSEPLHEVLQKAQRDSDRERRAALYRRAQEIIHKDAPWVVVAHAKTVAVIRRNVRNFVLHPTSWRYLWRVRIEPE